MNNSLEAEGSSLSERYQPMDDLSLLYKQEDAFRFAP